jgi:hypothetical protein
MKNKITIVFLGLALLSASFGCKKKEAEKKEVLDQNTGLLKNGSYVEGTVVTATQDDKPVEFAFKYEYQDADIQWDGGTTGSGYIGDYGYFSKDFVSGYSGQGTDYAQLYYRLDSLKAKNTESENFEMYAMPQLADGTVFDFYVGDDPIITDYAYDSINHVMTGNFSLNSDNTNNGQDCIVNGSFRYTNVKKIIFRKSN